MPKKLKSMIVKLLLGIMFFGSCSLLALELGDDVNLGGEGTVVQSNNQAFSLPFPKLGGIERLQFQAGDALFSEPWVTAPSSTTGRDGLGPLMISRACSNCHLRDGRGSPPSDETVEPIGLLVRVGSDLPHAYGDQLQNRSTAGALPEASIKISWTEQDFKYPDGKIVSLRSPVIKLDNLAYGSLPEDAKLSLRLAPPQPGLGLVDAIETQELLSYADPEDKNGDGISGRVNYVFSRYQKLFMPGKFGWKAAQPTLRDQNAAALNGDMGLTSDIFPEENCTSLQSICQDLPNGGNPEVTKKQLDLLEHYSKFIAVPARRNATKVEVIEGRQLFHEIGCASCHRPSLRTSPSAENTLLQSQVIWPYSDFLLHDMGEGLADDQIEGDSTRGEWRTPPLWGIGLTKVVNGNAFYLHDGRARTLEEAILWHGGEAENSKNRFLELESNKRSSVLEFLESL